MTPVLAGLMLVAALLVVLAACGASGSADPTPACIAAQAKIAPVGAAGTRSSAHAAANAAGDAFTKLNLALGALPDTSSNPEALINLRNAAAVEALDYHDLALLLIQPGSGLLGPLRLQGVAAYQQIDAAAAQLGTPACGARALGRALFDALVARTTAPAGPDLRTAAQTACQDIVSAYGTTQVAIDERAAQTQLQRSAAVLVAARNDIAAVAGAPGGRLRTALATATGILTTATGAVERGANPATTTTRAFAQAAAVIQGGFRSAGVGCAIPGA